MMIRYIGILLVVCCIASIGFISSAELNRRQKFWYTLILLSERLKSDIRFRQECLFTILRRSTDFQKNIPFITQLYDLESDFTVANIRKIIDSQNFSGEEKDLLCSFFAGLGKSDIKGQLAFIEMYLSEFKFRHKTERENFLQKTKLYKVLSLLASAAVFIVLI
ncbi:MAG: stage III sporulation protein AB [bacterium]|nr:stage III sporulation protein AB [bacterium]